MLSKAIGAYLMLDGLGSFVVFREQHWFWQVGRVLRFVLGAILFRRGYNTGRL